MDRIKLFFVIMIATVLSACSDEPECCDIVTNSYQVKLIDENGVNLLDPESPDAIDISKIRHYIVENGQTRMVDDTGNGYIPDNPYGIMPVMIGEEHAVNFTFRYEGDDEETMSIIQWNEEKTDTLICKFNVPGYPSYLTQISKGSNSWQLGNDNPPITVTLTY